MTEQLGIDVLFDTKGATQQSKNLTKSFSDMDKANKQSSKSGLLAMSAAVAVGNIMASGFSKLMGKMGAAIPALGETLSQAGTVIFNNLFKPLSDVLMPLLVKLMNWVRDNRTGFLQLGSVISGAFKFLFEIVSQVFGIISRITSKFFAAATGGAKTSFKSVADFLNLIILKIAFVIQFMLLLIEPVIDTIASLIIWLGKSVVVPFIKGFFEGLSEIAGAFDPLFEAFGELWKALKSIGDIFGENSGEISGFFKFLGKTLGWLIATLLKPFILLITMIVKGLAAGVRGIKGFIDFIKQVGPSVAAGFTGAGQSIRQFFSDIVDWVINKFHSILDWFKDLPNKIGNAVNSAMSSIKEKIKGGLGKLGKLFGSESEPVTAATGAAVNTSNNSASNDNSVQQITINGVADPVDAANKIIKDKAAKKSIQNQTAERGG